MANDEPRRSTRGPVQRAKDTLVLKELVRRRGTASSRELYKAIEHHTSGYKLSFQDRASLRCFISSVAEERGLASAHHPP